jgi:hypothetical protein
MSKLGAAGMQSLGGSGAAAAANYQRLVEETEYLLHRQRKKGKEYVLQEDPKKKKAESDYLASILGQAPGGGASKPAASPAKVTSPTKAKGGAEGGGAVAAGMDAYDPKSMAERELHELEETVRLRARAGRRASPLTPHPFPPSAAALHFFSLSSFPPPPPCPSCAN